jgi:hypothetical protein
MRRFLQYALGMGAAATLLAGCGGWQVPAAPSTVQSFALLPHVDRSRSWMLPEAKRDDLLYISDVYGVHVFSYPKGTHVGDLTGVSSPEGLCTDRAGDVFVTDEGVGDVDEYTHGGTSPIKVLYDIYVDFNPVDCSVDPTTGNVAVASADAPYVVIFPRAKQRPVVRSDPHAILFWCGYDDQGDLFVERVRYNAKFYVGELPRGATAFKNLLLDPRISDPSGLKFDGLHMVIEDVDANILYRLRLSGKHAIDIGNTRLSGATQVERFWIQKNRVIGPDESGTVYFWKYPLGGSSIRSIQGFTIPVGAAVSLASYKKPDF